MRVSYSLLAVPLLLVVLASCSTEGGQTSGSTGGGHRNEAGGGDPLAMWNARAGYYRLENPDNRTGFTLLALMAPATEAGKYPLRLAMAAGDYYYLCIPLKVGNLSAEDGAGTFLLEKPELVPEWKGEAPWWPFKAGNHSFSFEGEGPTAKLVLKMDGREYRMTFAGNHHLMAYQGNYLSAAGASRAEHLFLTIGVIADTSNVVPGFQEYDKRHSGIEVQVVDPETRLCRVTMKNFIYSPMSTTQTPTRTYPGRFVPTRSQWPGFDLVVDFGEGREVRYELSAK